MSEMLLRHPGTAERFAPDLPETFQDGVQTPPRLLRKTPDFPMAAQDAPKMLQDALKSLQDTPGRVQSSILVAFSVFLDRIFIIF